MARLNSTTRRIILQTPPPLNLSATRLLVVTLCFSLLLASRPMPAVAAGAESAPTKSKAGALVAFSSRASGSSLTPTFRLLTIPKIDVNRFSLVEDEGITVLKVQSHDASGSVGLSADIDLQATPILQWRWRVDHSLRGAAFHLKSGEDHAARVYVFFDVPRESLSFADRTRIRLARSVMSNDVPTAALCYVWDNNHPIGTSGWSPYTNRVRKIVLQSGNGLANRWVSERRDVAADYRAAFGLGPHQPLPRVIGVAVGSDTDQTNETVTAWFGDLSFGAP
jgi:hypothetical protein